MSDLELKALVLRGTRNARNGLVLGIVALACQIAGYTILGMSTVGLLGYDGPEATPTWSGSGRLNAELLVIAMIAPMLFLLQSTVVWAIYSRYLFCRVLGRVLDIKSRNNTVSGCEAGRADPKLSE